MRRVFQLLLCGLLIFSLLLLCGCTEPEENEMVNIEPAPVDDPVEPPVPEGPVGYSFAAPCGNDGFLACGTGGRIDFITNDGTVQSCESGTTENLNSIFVEDQNVVVAGDNGTLLISYDGAATFQSVDLKTDADLFCAVVYRGTLFAASEGGIIYRENPGGWEAVQMETTNDIISLAPTDYCLCAITAETNILLSTDGLNWKHEDFNKVYDGLYPRYVFTKAIPAGSTMFIIGYPEENPLHPLIMYSETGDVWMMKEMMKIDDEYPDENDNLQVHDICFNIDQIVGVLDDGKVLSITECTACNESRQMEEVKDLWATAVNEEGVLVCGEDFYAKVLGSKQIRQDKIGAEQALYDVESGRAILIDVREDDELAADGYIPNSVHIPLAEVQEKLPELASDPYQEIIFYCASGKRSQKAVEQAEEMGYLSVYNLGGLSNWPYDIIIDEAPAE